jgi:hypothetical protein
MNKMTIVQVSDKQLLEVYMQIISEKSKKSIIKRRLGQLINEVIKDYSLGNYVKIFHKNVKIYHEIELLEVCDPISKKREYQKDIIIFRTYVYNINQDGEKKDIFYNTIDHTDFYGAKNIYVELNKYLKNFENIDIVNTGKYTKNYSNFHYLDIKFS